MKVIIDPRSNYSYSSFYVEGLQRVVGTANVHYSKLPFRDVHDPGKNMRFVVEKDKKLTKVFLHLNDSYQIQEHDYAWSDVYGCVNANFTHCPQSQYPKLVSLVPSFGIRLESSLEKALMHSLFRLPGIWRDVLYRTEWNKTRQIAEVKPIQNIRHYFGRRIRAWKNRLPLSEYANAIPSEDNYIFFLSTLWYSDEWNQNDETVNLRRAHFIRVCKSIKGITYEGGLLGDSSSSKEKFIDVLAEHGEPFATWMEKTKRSALVFNTPAFWDCHGWKLGEYLALGKCIVSTKLSNDLPYPLEHGKNIHFVDDTEESMREAIEYILANPEYRHKLEKGARAYWEKYGTPEASLKLLGII